MTTELTKPQRNLPAHARLIADRAQQIQDMLPATFDDKARDRFVSTLVTAVATNPKLGECEHSSLVQAAYRVAQLGLDVGINCDLIPQKTKGVMHCRVSPGVKGMLKLAYESGLLAAHRYGIIYANEYYEADGHVVRVHRRMLDIEARGKMVGAYAVLDLTTGATIGRLLDMKRIARSRSCAPENSPWVTDLEAMSEKTALLDALKYMPFQPDLARTFANMHAEEAEYEREQPARVGRAVPVFRPQPMQLAAPEPVAIEATEAPEEAP